MPIGACAPKTSDGLFLLRMGEMCEHLIISAVGTKKGDVRIVIQRPHCDEGREVNEGEFSQ